MITIDDIPAEVRWEIAARSATAMKGAYGVFFGDVLGDRFNGIVMKIWIEGGKEARRLAEELSIPVKDAKDVDEAWGLFSMILFGPEIAWVTMEAGKDRAVNRINWLPISQQTPGNGS